MKKSDNIVDHVNNMMVMTKDLFMVSNVISKPMQISIILNSLTLSWDIVVIVLKVNFTNLSLDQFSLLLKAQQDHLNKNDELLLVQEKPSSSNVPNQNPLKKI